MNIRKAPAPIAAGLFVGVLTYVGLAIADPSAAKNDPWYARFRAAGFETHLYQVTPDLRGRIVLKSWSEKLADPKVEGARLYLLDIDGAAVQIAELPSEEVAKEMAALRKDARYWVVQEGRFVCIIAPVKQELLPAEAANKMLDVFKEGAKQPS